MKQGLQHVDERVVEDYTHLLPVFRESNPVAAQAAAAEMEYAVQKCLKLIATHSITASPKRKPNDSENYKKFASKGEYNKWIDDTYLLMGEANYYLREYHKAQESFDFILHNFPAEPTRNPAYLWLTRCYLETGEQDRMLEIFKLLERDGSLPKGVRKELLLVKANYLIIKGDIKEAISHLTQALKFDLSRQERGRYNFILAQLYQKQQQEDEALAAYRRVVKARPAYRMAFEAKISIIELSKGSPEEIDRMLVRMTRNGNNHPYLDRIYYAKGVVALKSGQRKDAVRDFQSSVTYSTDNNSQRALSSLTAARLLFEDGNYRLSGCYYDSTVAVIDQNYPGYGEIVAKANGLAALVRNLDLVAREDSLQRVAMMSEPERQAYIGKLIAEVNAKEELQKREQQDERSNQNYFRNQQYRNMSTGSFNNSETSNLWYFYNPVTAGLGKIEFQQIWGKRKLEDNWRRKNKISLNPGETDQVDGSGETQKKELVKGKELSPKSVEYYLQALPLSDSLLLVSNDHIKSALFAAGRIYLSSLKDEPHAIEMFEELNRRYPGSMYELSAWIELHKLKYKSDFYRGLITGKYPESNYARFLLNPDFLKELELRKQLMERKYEEATAFYRSGDYTSAGRKASEVIALQPDSFLLPKVRFIETIGNGKNVPKEELSKMLDKYLADFPGSPASPVARKILDLIRENSLAELEKMIARADSAELTRQQNTRVTLANDPFGGKYVYDEELFHYFVLSYPSDARVDVNRLIFDIANFNIDYYTSFDFDIEEVRLNEKINLVVVRSLPNKEEGLGYFGNILKQKKVFNTLKGVDYHYFIASSPNYRKMIADQELLDYLRFFVTNYSKNSAPVNP